MNKTINNNNGQYIGLDERIFYSKPAQPSDFNNAKIMEEYSEPDTPIKYLKSLKDQIEKIIKPTEDDEENKEENELVNRGVSI